MEENQRRAPRKYSDYVVEFYDPKGLLLAGVGHLIDLSATGALVKSAARLEPGQTILIRLRRGEHPNVDLPATIVRVNRQGTTITYGLRFIRS